MVERDKESKKGGGERGRGREGEKEAETETEAEAEAETETRERDTETQRDREREGPPPPFTAHLKSLPDPSCGSQQRPPTGDPYRRLTHRLDLCPTQSQSRRPRAPSPVSSIAEGG